MARPGGRVTTVQTEPVIEVVQKQFELDTLLALVRAAEPTRILEVGVWDGGTLRQWIYLACAVVAIDDQCRHPEVWQDWARGDHCALDVIKSSSHAEKAIREIAMFRPYDFVFIDADHTYGGVSLDWANFSPLVRSGGMVAFHDIVERPGYGVSQLWAEVKATGRRWVEIVDPSIPFGGIEVVWL